MEISAAGLYTFPRIRYRKTPPIRLLERLPEGTGIVIDDVGAGLYALAVMQILLHFGFSDNSKPE